MSEPTNPADATDRTDAENLPRDAATIVAGPNRSDAPIGGSRRGVAPDAAPTRVERDGSDRFVLVLAMLLYATLSAWMAVASKGFLEADGITHYLARRFALTQPLHLVDVWSRPLCVLLYCVPARLGGLTGTRLMSCALVLATVPLVIASARRLGLARPAWAGLFLLTEPLLFAHSFSELTEVPFALLLLAMFYAYQRRWFWLVAALAAVAPLGRPEGFGLIAVAFVAVVLHRRWWWAGLLPLGILGWEWAGWHVFGSPHAYPWYAWLKHNWPYSPDSTYGHGNVLWLTAVLPAVVGPVAFGCVAFGVPALVGPPRSDGAWRRVFADHVDRCRVLAVLVPLGVLAAHSLLWATGKMASNGEPRYLLVPAPFWAVLAAAGLEQLASEFRWRRPAAWIAVNAALAVVANLLYPCFPLGPQDDDRLADRAVAWIGAHPDVRERYPKLIAWEPHLFLRLDADKIGPGAPDPSQTNVKAAPAGTLLIWDSIYGLFNSDQNYCVPRAMLDASGWRRVATFTVGKHDMGVYLSPQDAAGRTTDVTLDPR